MPVGLSGNACAILPTQGVWVGDSHCCAGFMTAAQNLHSSQAYNAL